MFNQFKNLKFWIKFDQGKSIIGILIGLVVFCLFNVVSNVTWLNIIISLIIMIVSIILIQKRSIEKYADDYEEFNKKYNYVDPKDIRGFSENIDNILDLDKEVQEFLEKYSSGKKSDYFEKELNKQWKIHGKEFTERAEKILSEMNNTELMYTLLSTERIKDLANIVEYFKPFKIDVEYLKANPDNEKEYYYKNLIQQEAVFKASINKHYYKIIMSKNYFFEIEKFVLSLMSNEEIMELANSSDNWYEKIYLYGFLDSDKK